MCDFNVRNCPAAKEAPMIWGQYVHIPSHTITPMPHWSEREEIDGLVQERRNSNANALELRLSCTNPAKCEHQQNRRKHGDMSSPWSCPMARVWLSVRKKKKHTNALKAKPFCNLIILPRQKYSGRKRSIPSGTYKFLIPWMLITRSSAATRISNEWVPSMRETFHYLRYVSDEKWWKIKLKLYVSSNKFSAWRVKYLKKLMTEKR